MNYLYRAYQLIFALPLFIIVTFCIAMTMIVAGKLGFKRFSGYYPPRIYGWLVCRIFLLQVCVQGRENAPTDRQCIYVANHQGSFDIFLINGFLRRNFMWMLKWELTEIPIFGNACKNSYFVVADNRSNEAAARTFSDAQNVISKGMSVAIFPEGARTLNGKMARFHKSAFMLSKEFQLPIVPITIDGSYEALPRVKGFSFVKPTTLRLTVHPLIEPLALEADIRQIVVLSNQVRDIISSPLAEKESHLGDHASHEVCAYAD